MSVLWIKYGKKEIYNLYNLWFCIAINDIRPVNIIIKGCDGLDKPSDRFDNSETKIRY